jgi:RNA polymerase II subunit A small phosphatase-like protein
MRKLLILDLDETLIHATERPLDRASDFEVGPYFVYARPGLDEFLRDVAVLYRLAVWTSSSPSYADAVCSQIFGQRYALDFVWARDRCTPTRDPVFDTWSHAKRLTKLRRQGYHLEHIVMVDDSPEKHTKNYGNLVAVRPFTGDPTDRELTLLLPFLKRLEGAANVRSVEKRRWRLQDSS